MTTTAPAPAGEDVVNDDTPRCEFSLPAMHRRRGKFTRSEHRFAAYARTDAGSVLNLIGGRSEQQAAGALQAFLFRALVDDDGVSYEAVPRLLADDEVDGETPQDAPSDSTDVALVDADARWRLVWVDDLGAPTTELADPTAFDTLEEANAHGRENGSSLRRFTNLMAEPLATVELTDLTDATRTIAAEAAGRPTKPSPGSSGSRRRTSR